MHTQAEAYDNQLDPEVPVSEKALARVLRKKNKEKRQAKRTPKPLKPRNVSQARYIQSLRDNALTIGVGPAGVGKTYVPARIFGSMLMAGEIDTIYCARPNISKPQHSIGFLPGTPEEKIAPWLVPIFEGLQDSMSPSKFADAQRSKLIKVVPFEFMQGRTFKNCAAIIDEAENCDLDDLYIILTRQGGNCQMVVCGDPIQARIPNSGLVAIAEMAAYPPMDGTGVVTFTHEDVVRSTQARQWVKAFADRKTQINLQDAPDRATNDPRDFYNHPPEFLR